MISYIGGKSRMAKWSEVKTKEAKCKCGKYMNEIKKEFQGWPNIIRNERNGK